MVSAEDLPNTTPTKMVSNDDLPDTPPTKMSSNDGLSDTIPTKMGSNDDLFDTATTKMEMDLQPSIVVQEEQKIVKNAKGGWKTLPFIIGNEACERMGSLSVLWNLVPYFAERYHMSYLRAAYIVNAVSGTCSLTPLVGAYLADSYFGRYNTILGASFFNFLGLALLTVSATSKELQPKQCTPTQPQLAYLECEQATNKHLLFLVAAFALMAIGSGGLRSCVYSFGADQFDGSTPQGKRSRQSFFNWFYFFSCVSMLFGLTVIVYIQSSLSWQLGYLILSLAMVVSVVVFLAGSRYYLHLPTNSGPYSAIARVLIAASSKHHLPLPSDPIELHTSIAATHDDIKELGPRLKHTDKLRWLDKAAIVETIDDIEQKDFKNGVAKKGPWRLCTVQRVEECKAFLSLLPIWACTILLSVVQTQLGIFTVTQAYFMDQYLGRLKVAPASLIVVVLCTFILVIPIYDMVIVPLARQYTKNPRGLSLLQRIGVGILGFALTMVVAGLVERKRLYEINVHGKLLPIKWLLFQCVIIGLSDTFAAIGQFEFFYEELPRGMKSMAGAFFWSNNALGSYVANLLVFVVQKTSTNKGDNWLPLNINAGHLDYFYYLLSGFSILCFFLFIVCAYLHKPIEYCDDDEPTVDTHQEVHI